MYRNNNYDNQPSGSGESRNMQDSASGASPGGEGGAGRVYDAPAPPTMMGYPPQQFFAQGSFPTVGPPNQQQGQMPIPMMGGYFIQQPMGYPSMSSVNPYVGPGPYALHQGPVVGGRRSLLAGFSRELVGKAVYVVCVCLMSVYDGNRAKSNRSSARLALPAQPHLPSSKMCSSSNTEET
ncbi:hypothetical protein LshimejAT787_0402450 [Lyophyllum shimeji]|uniref:Uncharacterized protein n=1 Tax=Lyophyllum shimeji TaxID=47721 RepID=A0A9P3UJP7_LYOSH|nr:hypothetical protein LshimejAT787_0402450 [Lyophyllum shimeji]